MRQQLHASVWQEGEWFVAQCVEVDVDSQGETEDEALRNLAEALHLHSQPPLSTAAPHLRAFEVELHAA